MGKNIKRQMAYDGTVKSTIIKCPLKNLSINFNIFNKFFIEAFVIININPFGESIVDYHSKYGSSTRHLPLSAL